MKRRLLNLLTAVSLLLCVAVCVLWVRGYVVADTWRWFSADVDGTGASLFTTNVDLARGEIHVYRRSFSGTYLSERDARRLAGLVRGRPSEHAIGPPVPIPSLRPGSLWDRLGFEVLSRSRLIAVPPGPFGPEAIVPAGARLEREVYARAPLWPAALATALPPVLWAMAVCRRKTLRIRAERGRCVRCGYDLRATPGRCPECGKIAGAKPAP